LAGTQQLVGTQVSLCGRYTAVGRYTVGRYTAVGEYTLGEVVRL